MENGQGNGEKAVPGLIKEIQEKRRGCKKVNQKIGGRIRGSEGEVGNLQTALKPKGAQKGCCPVIENGL